MSDSACSAMARAAPPLMYLVLIVILFSVAHAKSNVSSEALTLSRIQRLLYLPAIFSRSNHYSNYCNMEPSLSLTIICYDGNITQLHIVGERLGRLPQNFSMDLFVTTLVRLRNLKVLSLVSLGLWGPLPGKISKLSSLEILNVTSNFLSGVIPQDLSSLSCLQTLILDDNMFSGPLQDWVSLFPLLAVFSAKRNLLNASLPNSLSRLENLRVVGLSHNRFTGDVPDLSSLTNLQVLDMADNAFGPQFPKLGRKLVTLVLSKNKFMSGIPAEVSSCYQLERLDLSFNMFIGPFPPSLLSLPSIKYLNVTQNKFTGMLPKNLSCNSELRSVDLSSNLLYGSLPTCLQTDSKDSVMLYDWNCLSDANKNQHPLPFCRNEALAVGIIPDRSKQQRGSKSIHASVIAAGTFIGVLAIIGIIFLVYRRINANKTMKKSPTRSITESASAGYTSNLLSDARYISQTMKLGALGLPSYRTFSLDELEEATNNFDTSTFMGEGSHGQMYRGQLRDGSFVAIRCFKLKRSHSCEHFMHHIEHILKLRHRNLVSALGHCLECYSDDHSVSRIFLVFEYVPNGTLRSWISERHHRRSLTWTQRISAANGIANGIQFLQTGIIPGVYSNKLKITDVLLDQNLVAKISSYNLPLLEAYIDQDAQRDSSARSTSSNVVARMKHEDATAVHDFGVILLEMIKGRPVKCPTQVGVLKDQLQVVIAADDAARRSMVDRRVKKSCLDQSLKTLMEICFRCLHNNATDRPSFDDVLWNLQYAAQVQDAWQLGECLSSDGSPCSSPSHPPRLTF